jgi:hypothetical protein
LAQFAARQHDKLFVGSERTVTDDAELAEVSWQTRFGGALDRFQICESVAVQL